VLFRVNGSRGEQNRAEQRIRTTGEGQTARGREGTRKKDGAKAVGRRQEGDKREGRQENDQRRARSELGEVEG